jgi:hypothetical protein
MAMRFLLASAVNRVEGAERGGQRHSCNGLPASQRISTDTAETFAQHRVNPGLVARPPREFTMATDTGE